MNNRIDDYRFARNRERIVGLRANPRQAEKVLKNNLLEAKVKIRRQMWPFSYWFICITTLFTIGVILFQGFGWYDFNLDPLVLSALVGSFAVEVVGVLLAIVKGAMAD